MIICNRARFVFFHNPKVAGASVHKSLESLHDEAESFWTRAPGGKVRAHYGVDEFAGDYPALWEKVGDYAHFALWRDPEARFLSSFGQHSKMYGEVDIRFAGEDRIRAFLHQTIEKLAAHGAAEQVMEHPPLTAFRPQWIYLLSERRETDARVFPLTRLEDMYAALEARTGAPIERIRINEKERLNLPGPLARVLGRGGVVRALGRLPGSGLAKRALRAVFGAGDGGGGVAKLTEADRAEVADFVGTFYARDIACLSRLEETPKGP